MAAADLTLLVAAAVALVAIAAARLGTRAGLPALLLFLLIGVALGNAGGVHFDDAALAYDLGFIALALILIEGGLTTSWTQMKPVLGIGLALAIIGSLVTIAVIGLFGYFVLGLPRAVAFLLGAVVAPTDAAAVFSVLRGVSLPPRVRAALETESGFNDAPTVLLVIAGTDLAMGHHPSGGMLGLAGKVTGELAIGVIAGLLMGWIGVQCLRRLSLSNSGLYPLAVMCWALVTYGLSELVHGSAFAAVYVCAVVLGNGQLPHRHATRSFAEGIGWVAQIGLFVMLGLLVHPSTIDGSDIGVGITLGLVLTFFARPLAVYASTVWFGAGWRQQAFMSWAGLRGAIPIILATVPLAAGMPGSDVLFDIIVVFVVVFTALQAPTLPWAARRLGLVDPRAATDVDIEVAPFDERRADLLTVNIPEGSHLAGVRVLELRLPRNAVVALVMRGDESFSPDGDTALETGDQILVVTPADQRAKVEARLLAVGRQGRLAGWTRKRPQRHRERR
ncbi:potassium/proton antiporter [Propionibacterium australiense]|uniref:Potassium/proton antiporter n=1 Tax=Propionibacterium australiense TaxID=119981 RepID=A0A383S538_9ACTN|nr:potassium/proton antiporter [Propionibacterium australiense]RLP08191.1 potassium/proton antiporter [Propionibacterium australiense]RLP08281.1 potassium/proton antiporter [Propionibacterium australiense]SYZ33105.1 Regulator of K+ conductance, C-terminal [Propionibacterium australiense]VEH89121.1 potassium/proton antiporter [Propionibacterium australiense]